MLAAWFEIAVVALIVCLGVATVLFVRPLPVVRTAAHPGGAEAEAAPAQFVVARDGTRLSFRVYSGEGPDLLVLLHGAGGDSRDLARVAGAVAVTTGLSVVTPDLRGHGDFSLWRGDVDHPDRLEHDIVDLFTGLWMPRHYARILIGGHSFGSGLAIRYAVSGRIPKIDGLILLSPQARLWPVAAEPGARAAPLSSRFGVIAAIRRLGIGWFDGWPVLRLDVPCAAQDEEAMLYSWRMVAAMTPKSGWPAQVGRMSCPVLVIAAGNDPMFGADGYGDIFRNARGTHIEMIPAIGPAELLGSAAVPQRIGAWLAGRSGS